jgi:hypothetical protein
LWLSGALCGSAHHLDAKKTVWGSHDTNDPNRSKAVHDQWLYREMGWDHGLQQPLKLKVDTPKRMVLVETVLMVEMGPTGRAGEIVLTTWALCRCCSKSYPLGG